MHTVTVICLANSRKPPSGRCIAGKRFDGTKTAEWIRPVSNRASHEVSEEERRYETGSKAQLLDIILIPLLGHNPKGHQVENYTLDDQFYWGKKGRATWEQVMAAADPYDAKFWNNSQSTYHGNNDKVAEVDVAKIGSSLKLILVSDLIICVNSESGFDGNPGRRRVRGRFTLKGISYLLSVTDPDVEEYYLQQGNGDYNLGEAALCISLVEVWNGFSFRVVASVITKSRCENCDG